MADHPRRDWNAAPPKRASKPLLNVPYGVVHHIGGGDPYTSNVAATLHQIQATELHGEYVDLSYNIGVDQHGELWAGRGDVADGATLGYSGESYSVLAICNAAAPGFVATDQMLQGIARAFREAMDRGVLSRTAYIDGHHWYDSHVTSSPTACPSALMESIPIIRSYVTGPSSPTAPVPPAPKPVSEEEPMLITSHEVNANGVWRGIHVVQGVSMVPEGGAALNPNPTVALKGWDWEVAADIADDPADGARRCQARDKKTGQHKTFRIK